MSDFVDDFLDPDYDPGEFDLVERRLRRSLHAEAARLEPADRLDDILATARAPRPDGASPGEHGGPGGLERRPGPPRWLAPAAAAAAVVLIAGTLWVAMGGEQQGAPPAGPSATQTSPPAPTQSEPPTEGPGTPTPSPTTTPPTAGAQRALLPVYYVGPVGGPREVFGLYREFLRGDVPATATADEKAKAALRLAVGARPLSNTDRYLQPWAGTPVQDVQVTPRRITITLGSSGARAPGATGAAAEETYRLAVQQLVWTVQAVVGEGAIPVTFRVADGSKALFGLFPAGDTYNRPPGRDEYYRDLAPIWVTAPARGAVVPSGEPVVVKGEATVFEATVRWELSRGGARVKEGFATASVGAPGRGDYTFSVGALPPGSYTIRMFAPSMKDGNEVTAEKSVAFTVK